MLNTILTFHTSFRFNYRRLEDKANVTRFGHFLGEQKGFVWTPVLGFTGNCLGMLGKIKNVAKLIKPYTLSLMILCILKLCAIFAISMVSKINLHVDSISLIQLLPYVVKYICSASGLSI